MHRLQGRLGLLAGDELPTVRTGVVLAAVAWLPPALFSLFDERSWTIAYGTSFFADFGSYARYLIAIFVLTVVDRGAEGRLNRLLACFVESGIIARDRYDALTDVLTRADRRTSSPVAEVVMLVTAYALAALTITRTAGLAENMWLESAEGQLDLAGWWAVLVSTPLFFFLVLRWLWRFAVWAALLRGISRIPLSLVATHPDRAGGLGFLTLFPLIFVPFTLALSVVVASSALQEVVFSSVAFEMLRNVTLLWITFVVLLFFGPLIAFSGNLLALRETGLIAHSKLVARYNRAAEQEMLASDGRDQKLDIDTISGVADLAPSLGTIYRIKPIPAEIWAVVPLVVAATVPMIMVASVQVPLGDLLRRLMGAFL